MLNTYNLGDGVRLSASFFDADEEAADPSAVVFSVLPPGVDAAPVTYTLGIDAEVIREAEGVFHVDLVADPAGTWTWRAVGSGDVAAATRDLSFEVLPSVFA